MVEMLNLYSSRWLLYFGMTVLQNTIFLAVLFLCFALLKHASARVKYAVGLLGLIKLLLPPFIPAALSNLFSGSTLPDGLIETAPPLPIAALPQAIEASAAPELSLKSTIFLVWAGAALLYVLLALGATVLLRLKLKRAVALQGEAPGRRVRLFQSSLINSPLSIGLAPRQIFVPTYWRTLTRECRSVLLKHELAHIERHDGFVQALQVLAQAIYFFHPLVWLLNERLNEYREMACDDAALQETNLSPEVYSRYLLRVAERVTHPHWSYVSASALIKQKNKLLQRIHYQIKEAAMKSSTKNVVVAFILLAVLIAPLSLYSKKSDDKVGEEETVFPAAEKETPEAGAVSEKPVPMEKLKVAYDMAPSIVGGYAAILQELKYPELAKKAGIEGRVFINVFIDKNGKVKETKIIKSLGKNGCDEAAVEAIKSVKWKPAKNKGEPVDVWVGIPVVFKLKTKVIKKSSDASLRIAVDDRLEIKVYKDGKLFANDERVDIDQLPSAVQKIINETNLDSVILLIDVGTPRELVDEVQEKISSMQEIKNIEKTYIRIGIDDRATPQQESGNAAPKLKGKFVAYDTPPQPIGGFAELQRWVYYPDLARKAGVEGRVYVNVLIDEKGEVAETKILKSLGNNGCDEAAIYAIKKVKWKPAKQGKVPVKVWVGIPVVFKLGGSNKTKEKTDRTKSDVHLEVKSEDEIYVNGRPATLSTLRQVLIEEFEKSERGTFSGHLDDNLPKETVDQIKKIIDSAVSALRSAKKDKEKHIASNSRINHDRTRVKKGRAERDRLKINSLTFARNVQKLGSEKYDIIYACEFNRNGTVKAATLVKSSGKSELDDAVLAYFKKYPILSIDEKCKEPIKHFVGVVLKH